MADLALELLIERDEVVHRVCGLTRQRRNERLKQRARRLRAEKRCQIGAQIIRIFQRKFIRIGLDEKVEGILYYPHNYEAGKRPLDLEIVYDLCERFDIHADWLLLGKGPIRPLPKK